jgi:parallel beta-helix repeat protein
MRRIVSVMILALLLAGTFVLAFNVELVRAQSETIYINSDGSVSPSDAPISSVDNVTYTFTAGVYNGQGQDGIIVERSNIVIDGAGYTVWGSWYGAGFYLVSVSNVTVENVSIEDFEYGVYLLDSNNSVVSGTSDLGVSYGAGIEIYSSFNDTVAGNSSTGNSLGIYLEASSDNIVSGNDETESQSFGISVEDSWNNTVIENSVTASTYWGISLDSASNNTVSGNTATENNCGISLCWNNDNNVVSGNDATKNTDTGIILGSSSNNVVVGNNATANGSDGIDIGGCSNTVVVGNNVTLNGDYGIDMSSSSDSLISGNTAAEDSNGIRLYYYSNNNVVCGNNATLNGDYGICVDYYSNNNIVGGNEVTANGEDGISLALSENNTVTGNTATANLAVGIFLPLSSDSIVAGNNATANAHVGIGLDSSSYITINRNNITANGEGIYLQDSLNDTIYHNNFIGNTVQASIDSVSVGNAWDDGPCGGNYWSDYETIYPSASEIDSSGIWNTPYVIDANNTDHYPLMNPYSGGPLPLFVTVSPISATLDVGQSQVFTSTAAGGVSPYTYQWYLNGLAVQDATSSSWTFTPTSAGSYTVYVEVDDSVAAQATSNTANATVNYIVHDVALTNVTVPVSETYQGWEVYQGWVVDVNVTVANLGNATESFAVTLSYNGTSVATLPVTDLAPNSTQTLVFSWNTTSVPCGNYTIEAETALAPGEINVASNVLVDGTLRIKMMGDVNGEGVVNMADIMTLLNAFGSYPGHPRWNPDCDLNHDGRIDLADIVLALMNFGKTS